MSHSFQYNKREIGELFAGKTLYKIPDYQRGFAWKTEEIEEFWFDINDALNQNLEQYFLGTIVLIPRKTEFEVVDGQQRIATLTMLFKIMYNKLNDYDDDDDVLFLKNKITTLLYHEIDAQTKVERLTMNKVDKTYYSKHLLKYDVEDETRKDLAEKDSEKRLFKAYSYLSERIGEVISSGGFSMLLAYYKYLAENVMVISIEAGDDADAFHIFESINAKGVPLKPLELLKNLLISQTKKANRSDIVSFWEYLSEKFSEAQSFRFVRYFWISKYELLRKKGFYRKVRNKVKNGLKPEDLLQDLKAHLKIYEMIITPQLCPNQDTRVILSGLKTLGATQVQPVLLSAGSRYGVNSTQFTTIAKALLSFVVRKFIVGKANPNLFETESGELARSLREKTTDTRSLKAQLRNEAPDQTFKDAFSKLEIRSNRVAKYLLKELNQSYYKTREVEIVGSTNLEHILPQTPKEAWLRMFDDGEEEYLDHWIHRLGNMTLLDDKLNKTIKNNSLKTKQKSYKKSEIKITKKLAKLPTWDYTDIEKRQKSFAQRAVNIWRI